MTQVPLRVAVILGSVRPGRFGPTVAGWFAGQARLRAGLAVDVVDLAGTALPMVRPGAQPEGADADPAAAGALREITPRLAAADAFVVVTPEYNHSFPAALKNAIDWHQHQWHAKPVGFVSYGGVSGGLRAVEALRLVFAELHAVTIRDTVSFHDAWSRFGAGGEPLHPEACNGAAAVMLDQLVWWAGALREAKARVPYLTGASA